MGPRSSSNNARREKALVVGGLGLAVLVILLGRLFILQVVLGDRFQELSENNWLRPESLPGRRGRILDRHGEVLADVVPTFSVMIDPQYEGYLRDPDLRVEVLGRLATLLDDDPERYESRLRSHRGRSYHPVRLVKNVDLATVTRVEENRVHLPGIHVETEPMRFYPHGSLASHALGYVQEVSSEDLERLPEEIYRPGSIIGRTGVESAYEDLLRGKDGLRWIEVSAVGRRSEAFLTAEPDPPQSGRDLRLTLDLGLQQALERALDRAPYDGPGKAPELVGAAVVIDVNTGEVLAMASRPTFDPNGFSRGFSQEEWDAVQSRNRPFFHRTIQARYPPASTFKSLTLYAGFDRGLVSRNTLLDPCWGGWQFGNRFFRCWRAAGHGKLNGEEALAHSCDTYFYQLGAELGVSGIREYADRFEVTEPTGIDIPGESRGFVPDRAWYNENYGVRGWSGGVALNLSIGQGEILLTPLELAVFTGVVATGGRRVTPRLLLRADGSEAEPVHVRDLSLDTRILEEVRRGMREAVLTGTAQSVRFSEVTAAAKTGTAETGTLENRGADNAVFVAYAPADDPQIALAVYLEGRGHGGAAAGPVARRILAAAFHIPFDEDEMVLVEGD